MTTFISCSAEQKIIEIPCAGEAVVAGYWSHELGLCSQSALVKWEDGKVCSMHILDGLVSHTKKTEEWDSYFLLPGWLDAHVHVALDSLDFFQCLENWAQPSLIEENIRGYLRRYLERGIVGIRDGGDLPGFAWSAKNKVDQGIWVGPRIISVHEAIQRKGMYGRFLGRGFENIVEWREHERDFFRQGVDQLKVIVTGLIKFDDFQQVGPTQWSVEDLTEVVEAAHRREIPVMAHASGEKGISTAIAAGVDTIEHGYYITTEQLKLISQKGIAWVPTVAPIGNLLKYPTDRYSDYEIDILKRILQGHLTKIHEAYLLEVRIGVGTDAGAYRVPHGDSLYDEMDWMVQAGIPKLDVCRMATHENACILGSPELGRLEAGTPMSSLQLVRDLG